MSSFLSGDFDESLSEQYHDLLIVVPTLMLFWGAVLYVGNISEKQEEQERDEREKMDLFVDFVEDSSKCSKHRNMLQRLRKKQSRVDAIIGFVVASMEKTAHPNVPEWILQYESDVDTEARDIDRSMRQAVLDEKTFRDQEEQLMEQHKLRKQVRKMLEEPVPAMRLPSLKVEESLSNDEMSVYLGVKSPGQEDLEHHAEVMKLLCHLKEEYGGGFVPFQEKLRGCFVRDSTFSSLERQRIVRDIMEKKMLYYQKDLKRRLNLDSLVETNTLTCYTQTHEPTEIMSLAPLTRSAKMGYKSEMLIKLYFGEEVAIYFSWLTHYTNSLLMLGLPGLALFLARSLYGQDNIYVIVYCVYQLIWNGILNISWKRHEARLVLFDWDLEPIHSQNLDGRQRANFISEKPIHDITTGEEVEWYPDWKRALRQVVSYHLLLGCVVVSGVVTLAIMSLEPLLTDRKVLGNSYGKITIGIVTSLTINLCNSIGMRTVTWLTDFENHRTHRQWGHSFVIKKFVIEFTNSYGSLFFIAFMKEEWAKVHSTFACESKHCLGELETQLAIMMITQAITGQLLGIFIPMLLSKLVSRTQVEQSSMAADVETAVVPAGHLQSVTARQSANASFTARKSARDSLKAGLDLLHIKHGDVNDMENVFAHAEAPDMAHEYGEMITQFGFITLFAAAFPVGAMISYLNNKLEFRTDIFKLLYSYRRAPYICATDIGVWYYVLKLLGYLSIVTNLALLIFKMEVLCHITGYKPEDNKWLFFLTVEHIALFFKFGLDLAMPLVPDYVILEVDRQKVRQENKLKTYMKNQFGCPEDSLETLRMLQKLGHSHNY